MIDLKHAALRFSFPDVHPGASLAINFVGMNNILVSSD